MEQYNVEGRVGEGAHGLVLMAKHIPTGREVALKKVLLKKVEEGIPNSVVREIKSLQEIDCKYVMKLLDVFPHGVGFILVFDYMPSGLWEMIYDVENPLFEGQIKSYMQMLLKGVEYLHAHSIMHRDLKPANLLISSNGVLRIADLGLGRVVWSGNASSDNRLYSHQVATRWYRAPELLYGARRYNCAIDLWAVGCILAELNNRSPLFPALAHAYFYSPPLPCSLEEMPHPPPDHRQRLKSKQISVDKPMRQLFNTLHSYFND